MSKINVNTLSNELENGGPDFTHMPTVAGDPVVESGSNSDGEWVRWADGTQVTRQRRSVAFSASTDSTYQASPLPVVFIDAAFTPSFSATLGSSGNQVTEFTVIPLSANADFRFSCTVSNSNTWTVSVNCIGRWK